MLCHFRLKAVTLRVLCGQCHWSWSLSSNTGENPVKNHTICPGFTLSPGHPMVATVRDTALDVSDNGCCYGFCVFLKF